MSRRHTRTLWFLPGVVAFAALAVHAHRERDELTARTWPGPEAALLVGAADERLDAALLALQQRDRPIAERLAEYRAGLEDAESLLVRSVVARPTQAGVLAKLAAVRWELDPRRSVRDDETGLLALSSRLAPHDPAVQERLAALLLRVGRHDEAFRYLRRAVDLDPGRARSAATLLSDNGVAPKRALRELGPSPVVLVALRASFAERGEEGAWLDAVDSTAGRSVDAGLLIAYADACLRARAPGRLRDTLDRIGTADDPGLESQRLQQRARAWLALGRPEAAVADAVAAADLVPDSADAREHLGDVMTAAGRDESALRAYRSALDRAARKGAWPRLRGRLYGKIGRAEEALGRTDPAIDAYRLAVRLDPDQPIALERLDAMALTH